MPGGSCSHRHPRPTPPPHPLAPLALKPLLPHIGRAAPPGCCMGVRSRHGPARGPRPSVLTIIPRWPCWRTPWPSGRPPLLLPLPPPLRSWATLSSGSARSTRTLRSCAAPWLHASAPSPCSSRTRMLQAAAAVGRLQGRPQLLLPALLCRRATRPTWAHHMQQCMLWPPSISQMLLSHSPAAQVTSLHASLCIHPYMPF